MCRRCEQIAHTGGNSLSFHFIYPEKDCITHGNMVSLSNNIVSTEGVHMAEKRRQTFAVLCTVAILLVSLFLIMPIKAAAKDIRLGDEVYPSDSTELSLSGISPEEVEAALPLFPNLRKVILSDTGADDETLDTLNRKYPDIDIVWTVMIGKIPVRTDAAWFYVAKEKSLPTGKDLEKLRYCTEMIAVDVGHLRVSDCSWLESMPHVKYLILADTRITDLTPLSNLKELIYLELFNMQLKDYSPLLGCTALQDLNISNTHADPEPLSHMTWLHNLQWYQGLSDPATRDAVKQLPEQLPQTNVLLNVVGKISDPWRSLPNYYVFRDIIGAQFLNQTAITRNWGQEDAQKILACDRHEPFAGDVLAEIVKYRIENDIPIIGAKDTERAQILYQTLCDSHPYD